MLSARNIAALGFMTFAMYLGAGNLIFPPFLGYQAGENVLSGMSGFRLTGVGLPAMALVMVAIVNGSDKLTAALPKPLATSFWVMVFIVIMAQQPLVQATLSGGAMMIVGNTAGGIVAIVLYNLIAAVPSYGFLIMLRMR